MHIVCVDVTNRCDLRCSNCTRLLANQRHHWDMSSENFRTALRSLKDYPGVIAMIGGNPCLHKRFPELCAIFVEEIADKRQRGLWSNNVFDHQEIIRDTFGFFNLNPHNDQRGIESLTKLREMIPGLPFYEGNSRHAPLLAAVKDIIPDEAEMWDAIADCDINKHWSASIVENQGNLRAYFCEVAASFDLARGEDHGHPVTEGWWRQTITDFADQVKHFCPGCGVAARLTARLDADETDDYTVSNTGLAARARGRRKIAPVVEAVRSDRAVTDYSEQHRRPDTVISVVIPCYNAAGTISETIRSVLAQKLPADMMLEIIVADDGSMDRSDTIVGAFGDRVRFLPAHGNTGPAAARNRGLRAATGDFVCFLDADDIYAPGFFEAAAGTLREHPEWAGVITNIELVNNHREVHPLQLQAIVFSIPSNMMVRRLVAEMIGGFPEDQAFRGKGAGEDCAFKQVLVNGFQFAYLTHPYLHYRVSRGSHFDLFMDSSRVVGDKLEIVTPTPEDIDGSRPAAVQAYMKRAMSRLQAVEACRRRAA